VSAACPGNAVVSPRFNGVIRRLISLLVLELCLVSLGASAGQLPQRWRWSNPRPFGGSVYDMAYGFGLTVAVTERGGIHTSEDLIFWEPRESHTSNALRAVTFFGSRLVVTGEQGTVLYADSLEVFHLSKLGTEDWLEGVAASTNLLVAVGDNGAIYTSRDGAAWARQSSTITAWLSGVARGAGNFVAVGEGGLIATSPNGTNWTKRASGTTRYLYRVAYAQNQFLAMGEGGLLLSSANGGLNWTPVSSGATGALYGATGILESQAVVGDGEVRQRTPTSGWSNELDPAKSFPAPRWTYFNALWQGSLYFISGRSGLMVEGFQTNAAGPFVWIDRNRSVRNWLWELHRTPDFYITVGYRGTVMTSVNGVDWSLEFVPPSVSNATFLGIGGTTNLLIAVGDHGRMIVSPNSFTNLVQTNLDGTLITNSVSTLGIIWHSIAPLATNDLQGVAATGNQFVLTGDLGIVLTSSDGTNWIRRTTLTASFLTGVAAFPGGLVAVGSGGTLLTSADGINWTNTPTMTTNWLYRVRYVGGRLIVVGQNGTILTSPDAVVWTQQASPTARWLNDVTQLDDTFYVVGTQGAVLASSNAIDWISIGTITDKSLYGVASHDGQLVAAGVEGAIVRSQVIADSTPVRFLNFSRRDNQNIFLISGKPDQRFTLDRSSTFTNWSRGVTLEILDSSGTLLFLENTMTNSRPSESYRATLVP
jgi:hypothetical protein